ncbi:MAG: presqualene diphosphate synthase HpnD [Deltaproteobacteria bacterium]|nr:presqualene diphosphate synthase HpnD [Deltaproteobacteria bacterium]
MNAPHSTPVADAAALAAAYAHCQRIATTHYENFTVGSWLLPRRLRRPLAAIYAFARLADDFADEGDAGPAERLAKLDAWEAQLIACYAGRATHPVFLALADTARRFAIPIEPFQRLLTAFRRDAAFAPFADFDSVLDYCAHSAAPVGHLVLALFGYDDAERRALADRICIGLQLANFWQDVAVDAARGRAYLPLDRLQAHGLTLADLRDGTRHTALRALLRAEVDRARTLLLEGLPLAERVAPRLGREVRLFAWGGLAILARIEAQDYDVCRRRPTVPRSEHATLILRALLRPTPPPRLLGAPPLDPVVPARRDAALQADYEYCAEITRRSSSNFYYAFHLLPPARRAALCAVYAFCRFVDDVADDVAQRDPEALLGRWRDELGRVYRGAPTHPIGRALADAARRFPLAERHFADLIRGVELDLTRRRYASFEELHEYCYLVASTVGLLCIEIFGHQHASARDYATDLGVAFQLTNILRDVTEDAARGRIYLPLDDLRRFDCAEADLLAGRYSPRVGALLAFECGRARAYYLRAAGALAAEDRAALAPAEAMRLIYQRLLRRIEARHFDVFGATKITLPRYEKVTLALTAWGRAQLAGLQA